MENSKSQIVTKTQKLLLWQKSEFPIVMKHKNTNCDKTQKLKLWQNSKTKIVTILRSDSCDNNDSNDSSDSSEDKNIPSHLFPIKLCHNSNCDKTQIVTKLKISNC